MSVSYPDVLLLTRLEKFVRAHWPQRRFCYDRHWPGSLSVTRHVYFRWVIFRDDAAPRAVGAGLSDVDSPDPLFEIIEWHSASDVRRSLWRYGAAGWRHVDGETHLDRNDGTALPLDFVVHEK